MMRRLVQAPSRQPAARHRREHLARHHLDLHLCAGAVRGACRPLRRRRADARFRAFPFRLHGAVRAAYGRGERRRGGHRNRKAISASFPAFAIAGAGPWWTALEFDAAPKIIARLPFVERADHPAAHAGLRDLARRRRRHGDRDRSLEHAGVRLERGGGQCRRRRLPTSSRCPIAPSTAPPCWSRSSAAASTPSRRRFVKIGASIRSSALVGSHATRYTVPAKLIRAPRSAGAAR